MTLVDWILVAGSATLNLVQLYGLIGFLFSNHESDESGGRTGRG